MDDRGLHHGLDLVLGFVTLLCLSVVFGMVALLQIVFQWGILLLTSSMLWVLEFCQRSIVGKCVVHCATNPVGWLGKFCLIKKWVVALHPRRVLLSCLESVHRVVTWGPSMSLTLSVGSCFGFFGTAWCSTMKWESGVLLGRSWDVSQFRVNACKGFDGGRGFGKQWRLFLCLASLCRVGEAAVPGPGAMDHLRLGVCNPSGLYHKASLFAMQEADVWIVSETHLTRLGLSQFRAELSALQSPFNGHPVLPRNQISEVGKWAGMAVVSKCPSRPLVHHWEPSQYATGRLVASTSYCRGLWISGVGVYGTPVGPTHPRAKETTEKLLGLAVQRIQQAVGCRYVAGDWNHDHNSLQAVTALRSMGFVDVQDLHYQMCGVFPIPTCRGKTRRDYLYISPELAQRFVCCRVDPLAWTDHASVVGEFRADSDLDVRYVWPIPSRLDWKSLPGLPLVDFEKSSDLDATYRLFWKQREDAAVQSAKQQGVQILPGATGRGLYHGPQPCCSSKAPVKKGRGGEAQPGFLGYSLRHVHWFKQLRRLQSFARIAAVASPSDQHSRHIQLLWEAILRAPGFQPTFMQWWSSGVGLECGVPALSWIPPNGHVAELIFVVFNKEVQRFEKALVKHKNYAARLKRTGDIASLYRKVRRDAPDQVDILFHEVQGVVSQVDAVDSAVEFDQDVPWRHDAPVFHRGRQLTVHHAEKDKLWLDTHDLIEVGDSIVQPQSTGSLPDLFRAFSEQWKSRWVRHASLPPERWDVIIAFAEKYLRPVQAPELLFTPSLLRAVIHRKKKLAATGLDGVSRHDLVSLDANGLGSLLSLYKNACQTGCWPQQVLNGAVKSLAKRAVPSTPDHFRPVTVFSMVYRCWSSAESRYWLSNLDDVLDPMLLGNRKGKRAADVWRCMLDHLEESQVMDQSAAGLILDLEKAFNTLPRKPTLAAVRLLGLPFPIVRAWAGALGAMKRHFAVRGSYSPGLLSDCGFPEGCGLSCLAMVAVDQLFHCWVDKSREMVRAVTFVDNWELLIQDPSAIRSAFDRVLEFTSLLDLTIDEKKTVAWSNDPDVRRSFRQQGFRVDLAVRELGAQLTFSKQIRNATLLDRVNGLRDFWSKLKTAGGTFDQKARLIFTGAWPRAFHGISACYVGKKHWIGIRAEFMNSVGLNKPGASSWLQLAQERIGFDPQAFAVVQTIRDFREFANTDLHAHRLDLAHSGDIVLPPGSVSEILLARLQLLGWTWTSSHKVFDGHSHFSLGEVSWKEFELRFDRSWGLVVANQVKHRDPFCHFDKVDLGLTRRALRLLSPHERAILRPCLNGSMFTLEHAFRWSDAGQDTCPRCSATDSAYHRLWTCPWTSALRDGLCSSVLDLVPFLPSVLAVHGWSLTPCTRDQWWSCLHDLSSVVVPSCPLPDAPVCDLFTDGSCWWPSEDYRVSAWAVVLASDPHLDCEAWSTSVIASGPLPGIVQSAHRAELFAMVAVAELIQGFPGVVRVWTDCLSVVNGFHNFILGRSPIPANHKHADLWKRLQELLSKLTVGRFLVGKVPAHEELHHATTDLEQWAYVGNHAADRAANVANQNRPSSFWRTWQAHATAVVNYETVACAIRGHLIKVSEQWQASAVPEVAKVAPVHKRQRVFLPEWTAHEEITCCVGIFGRVFQTIADRFLHWWHSGIDNGVSVKWVSFSQLYIDWQLQTGHPGMIKFENKWVDPLATGGCTPEIYQFKLRSKWWRLCVQRFVKDHGIKTKWVTGRPESPMLQCFIGCISLPWSNHRLQAVDKWLRASLRSPALGQGQLLDTLPLVS